MSKIIVADDSYAHRKIIVQILKGLTEKKIIEANNGIEVIICDLADISLLITDIIMPQMDGLKLIHYIRNIKKNNILPIIVISSALSSHDIIKIRSLGVSEIIKKPVDKVKLIEIIRNYI